MTLDSVSVDQSGEGDGRTDPSVTFVAFHTDATTVLKRLAVLRRREAAGKRASGMFSTNGTVRMTRTRQWLEAGRQEEGLCGRGGECN
jgi:hypothetical protein